jgi:hypothetical protein
MPMHTTTVIRGDGDAPESRPTEDSIGDLVWDFFFLQRIDDHQGLEPAQHKRSIGLTAPIGLTAQHGMCNGD